MGDVHRLDVAGNGSSVLDVKYDDAVAGARGSGRIAVDIRWRTRRVTERVVREGRCRLDARQARRQVERDGLLVVNEDEHNQVAKCTAI